MSKVLRRDIIDDIRAAAGLVGFDPNQRAWVGKAKANASCSQLPPLDGVLSTASDVVPAVADDWGHIVHRTPIAVLFPGSVNDVVAMVKFARAHGIRIAARGKAHSPFGQAQADAGLVIDLVSLDTIHSISEDCAVVDGGVVWRDLLIKTTAVGLTPPVVTNYIGVTVAGTLSVGGISGSSFRHGAQVDNVRELQIVTGEGELVTCSADRNSHLFNAALAGLGLCGIIVRATLRLIPAQRHARTYRLFYRDAPSMLHDLRGLVDASDLRLDHIRGNAAAAPPGWDYYIEATSFCSGPDDAATERLLAGLSCTPGSLQIVDQSYFDWCDEIYQLIEFLEHVGLASLPHPWLDVFVPDSKIDAFAQETMARFDPADFLPPGLVLFYPFVRSRLTQPMLSVPDEEKFFLFDLIRTTVPDPAVIDAVLRTNREIYDQNLAQGGTLYTISAVQLSPEDWKRHFHAAWGQLNSAKKRHDPDNILGAGVDVFPAR